MTSLPTSCPKCDGEFVPGFQLDTTSGGYLVSHWAEGKPKLSWLGLSLPPSSEWLPLAALRCESCGYVEFYARPEFNAK